MSVMILLIVACILFAGGFLAAFIWAVRSGQFDDGYTPSVRMLFDDRPARKANDTQTDTTQRSKS